MNEYRRKDLSKLLKRNALELRRAMRETDSEAGRIYDGQLPEVACSVDLFGSYALITDTSNGRLSSLDFHEIAQLVARFSYCEEANVIIPRSAIQTATSPVQFTIKEHGVYLATELGKTHQRSILLDQSLVRQLVQHSALQCHVLIPFAHFGTFSAHGAVGGASGVTSLCSSLEESQWCLKNLTLNGFQGNLYPVVQCSIDSFLQEANHNHKRYQLVVYNPRYGNFLSASTIREHFELIHQVLDPQGTLIVSGDVGTPKWKDLFTGQEITYRLVPHGFIKTKIPRTYLLERNNSYLHRQMSKQRGERWEKRSDDYQKSVTSVIRKPSEQLGTGKRVKPYGYDHYKPTRTRSKKRDSE